jgi:hypothetical protein
VVYRLHFLYSVAFPEFMITETSLRTVRNSTIHIQTGVMSTSSTYLQRYPFSLTYSVIDPKSDSRYSIWQRLRSRSSFPKVYFEH